MKTNEKRLKLLKEFEKKVDYKFEDIELLNLAFFHSSYANENKNIHNLSNERLEFLGDSVVDLVVSDILYKLQKDIPEGEMTKLRSQMVCESSFAFVARKLDLGKYLLMGKGEELSGGRNRDSILADTFEAICGAIYLDSNFDNIYNLLSKLFYKIFLNHLENNIKFIDYKTKLQEYNQQNSAIKLKYKIEKEEGPDHDKTFYVAVYEGEKHLGSGVGKSKKSAEQSAAKDALSKCGVLDEEKN